MVIDRCYGEGDETTGKVGFEFGNEVIRARQRLLPFNFTSTFYSTQTIAIRKQHRYRYIGSSATGLPPTSVLHTQERGSFPKHDHAIGSMSTLSTCQRIVITHQEPCVSREEKVQLLLSSSLSHTLLPYPRSH